jgi:hypothetical protein
MTSVWARWKGILKNKIREIRKPNNNNFFPFFFVEVDLKRNYSKISPFSKSKKIMNERQL